MTFPETIIEVLSRTSVECPLCQVGRLEIISSSEIYCCECGQFFSVEKSVEKAYKNSFLGERGKPDFFWGFGYLTKPPGRKLSGSHYETRS